MHEKLISRAGKATGTNKNCYNTAFDKDGAVRWVNDCVIVTDDEESVLLFNSDEVEAAKKIEIMNWKYNNVFEEEEDASLESISFRWVITENSEEIRTVLNARFVMQVFEEDTYFVRNRPPVQKSLYVLLFLWLHLKSGKFTQKM